MSPKDHVVQSLNFPRIQHGNQATMPAQQSLRAANSPRAAWSLWSGGVVIGLLAAGLFALGLRDAPFVDEYAYITQSYQPDLVFSRRMNDASWLDGLGYDLVPLPKFWINLAFRAAGIPRPSPWDALAWYDNTSQRWGTERELLVARLPSIVLGAAGCVAIFAIGTILRDERTGAIAAFLLAINPLYSLHAHRAMSEAGCEAFLLAAVALGLRAWKSLLSRGPIAPSLLLLIAAGCSAGLSILSKFNGILVLFSLVGWTCLALALPRMPRAAKLGLCAGTGGAIMTAWAVFVALNPFMTAHPAGHLPAQLRAIAELSAWQRFRFLVEHRSHVSSDQQGTFVHNALPSLTDKAGVVLVQGFGRFGPLGPRKSDSTRRYDLRQDWGAFFWLPVVLAGVISAIRLGKQLHRQSQAPTGWALVVWSALALLVVTVYLPMAWDRYQLPIQAPAALLAALPLASATTALRTWITRPSQRR
jgi:4-amino-4-deoxy-L-arabinose transferase-like glycosyltransferase